MQMLHFFKKKKLKMGQDLNLKHKNYREKKEYERK